jgi:hypothetical protein
MTPDGDLRPATAALKVKLDRVAIEHQQVEVRIADARELAGVPLPVFAADTDAVARGIGFDLVADLGVVAEAD